VNNTKRNQNRALFIGSIATI